MKGRDVGGINNVMVYERHARAFVGLVGLAYERRNRCCGPGGVGCVTTAAVILQLRSVSENTFYCIKNGRSMFSLLCPLLF